jgi:spermidine synthase
MRQGSPVEVLYLARGARQTLLVERQDDELRLKILSTESGEWQSRLDLRHPTRLVAPYMRAMMLALLLRPEPRRVLVLGLGAGRMPVFLRRLRPRLRIDCVEIDPDVHDLAVRYFGFRSDPLMEVAIWDGRAYLETCPPERSYDVIFVDAFCGIGGAPLRLSSREFYQVCRERLAPAGVVAVNVMAGEDLTTERLRTLACSFATSYLYRDEGALVAFGVEAPRIGLDELWRRAEALQPQFSCGLSFPGMVRSLERMPETDVELILDGTSPLRVKVPESVRAAIRDDDSCPCGSLRRFSECHGTLRD